MTSPFPFVAGARLDAADLNAVGMFHIKTEAVSGTPSSVEITSAFSSTFDNYRVVGYALGTSGAGNDITMKLGTGTQTTTYYGNTNKFAYNVSGSTKTNHNNTGPMPIAIDNTAGGAIFVDVTIYAPQVAGYTAWQQKTGSLRGFDVNGFYNSVTQFTSVTFECSVGNWTQGEFRLYGIVDG